ncbi:MAG: endonuclease/exonuclease/phosphatase family protein [Stenotrophomonas sp.]|uniref:endonuclease/exonuclease/phosphatase family protein n=1 Tax=Stenotrophomonas sp. TaxID=69392 RepID=UPI003D6CD909
MLSFSVLAEPAMPVIKIASLRLPAAESSWAGSRDRIAALMEELHADVIVVQDVSQSSSGSNPACWLGSRLKYSCDFISADRPSQAIRHGHAVLSRLTTLEDAVTLLHGDLAPAAAGMQRLELQRARMNLYAATMRPADNTPIARGHQAADLRSWMDATSDGLPSLIIGDFAAPTEELVRQLPGFQPARRNPSMRQGDGRPRSSSDAHGMDVLYQVRSFADIRQQAIDLPANDSGPAQRLGAMATLRLTQAIPAETTEEEESAPTSGTR